MLPQSKKISKVEIKPAQTMRQIKKPLVDLTNKYKQNKTKETLPNDLKLNKSYSKPKPNDSLLSVPEKSPLRTGLGHSIAQSASALHRRESMTKKYVNINMVWIYLYDNRRCLNINQSVREDKNLSLDALKRKT